MADLLLPTKYKNPIKLLSALQRKPEQYWMKQGETRALKLFHEMASRVPAYKNFLRKNSVNPKTVKTISDFKTKVPLISKENYLKKYPLEQLCWDGDFRSKSWDISSTSGSTGEPFYFPRDASQNAQYAATAELYLRSNFEIHKKSTLYINCFALGVWIGGIFTYEAIKTVAENGAYPLTLINPGLNKIEIIKTVKNLGNKFDQIIIGGYPPFIKDVIDDGIHYGLKWNKYSVKFIFSAEGFSEEFRNYIAKKTGLRNIYKDTLNHYGTVDQGTIAHETPLSILIRRLAIQRPKLFKQVFRRGLHRLPTLCQYDPELFFFEEVDGGVVCSSYSGLPLVRYDLRDHGGVHSLGDIKKAFKASGIDFTREVQKVGISPTIWNLPFVYVYERIDLAVSVSGANVYPETIKRALHNKILSKIVTGKFIMLIEADKDQNQYLKINIELKNGVRAPSPGIKKLALDCILQKLLRENSEYRIIYDQKKNNATPRLTFLPYEHSEYFRVGGKQKWSKK